MARTLTPRVRIDANDEYGYLFWTRAFTANGQKYATWYMSGNGGNKVAIVPELELVAVLASANYNAKGMHDVTTRLLEEAVLAAVE